MVAVLALVLSLVSLGWQVATAYRHRRRLTVSSRPLYRPGTAGDPVERVYAQVTARALWGPQGIEDIEFEWEEPRTEGWSAGLQPDVPSMDGTWPPLWTSDNAVHGIARVLQDGESASWVYRIAIEAGRLPVDARVRPVVLTTAGRRVRGDFITIDADRPSAPRS